MFSSDPAPAHGAAAARRPVRPSVLSAAEVAALGIAAPFANEWAPLHVEPEAFELPEFDAEDLADAAGARDDERAAGRDAAPARDPRAQLMELVRAQAEVMARDALAEREADEAELRDRLRAEAYAAGVESGRAEAEAAAHEALSSAIEALWIATEEVRGAESRWLAALQDNLAALVSAAARHVIGREVRADDTLVRELAERAVAEFPQDHPVQLRVCPADLDTLRVALASVPRSGEVRFTADPRVERGGCLVEGRERIVDGRVDTALERLYRRLSGHHA
jgi:flagellar biosynthesis/type III secretory pathway protein FliH